MPGVRLILGPQRPTPNVPALIDTLPGDGHVVAISAGWRHDEIEQPKVLADLGVDVLHLPLYKWFNQIRKADLASHGAHHARQLRVQEAKRLYRVRLRSALDAYARLRVMEEPSDDLLEDARAAALEHVRSVDAAYLDTLARITVDAGDGADPWLSGVAATGHARAREALQGARAVLVAGGHVGVLFTRLRFFGLQVLLQEAFDAGTSLVAWSAGAMALSDRVVLFDDDTPQGFRFPELFDRGLGLMPGAVFLPHARTRLRLDEPERVARFVKRFAPASCIGLEPGAALRWQGDRWHDVGVPGASFNLTHHGAAVPCEGADAPGP